MKYLIIFWLAESKHMMEEISNTFNTITILHTIAFVSYLLHYTTRSLIMY